MVKAQKPSGDSYDDADWIFPFEHYLAGDLRLAEMVRAVKAGRIVNPALCASTGRPINHKEDKARIALRQIFKSGVPTVIK